MNISILSTERTASVRRCRKIAEQVLPDERDVQWNFNYHVGRYSVLLDLADQVHTRLSRPIADLRVLDIGPAVQTALLRKHWSDATIDSLGFKHESFFPRQHEKHIEFDLGELEKDGGAASRSCRDVGPYDLVVFAEVIEHLYVAPEIILKFIGSTLRKGGFLILQTPNAASAMKRIKMVLGSNPYMRLRMPNQPRGHIREYTARELHGYLSDAGFSIESSLIENLFTPEQSHPAVRILRSASGLGPASLRDTISILSEKM